MDITYEDFLEHYGVKGQKWGVRRFQDEDGKRITIEGSGGGGLEDADKTEEDLKDLEEEISAMEGALGQTTDEAEASTLRTEIERKKQIVSEGRKRLEQYQQEVTDAFSANKELPKVLHNSAIDDEEHLEHHGIKGQKWGVRKYQNDDGSLTPAGRLRYGVSQAKDAAVATVKKVASATGNVAKKVAVATGHGVAKAGKATANKVGEVHAARKAEKREKKIREWSTDLNKLQKHQTELTDDEFREALNRANMNRQLSDLKKAEIDRGLSYLKSAAQATGDTLMLANNVSKMITGKSFEDLRKAPSESDKIKLESERTKLAQEQEKLHQAQVASRNAEAQARDKEDLEQYNKKVREEAYNKTHYQNQMEAEKGEREYKAQKKLWDDTDRAMKEARRTEQNRIREEMNEASIKKDAQYKNGKRLASDNAAKKEAQKLNLNEEQTKLFVENRRHSQGYSSDEKYANKLSSAVRQKRAEDAANAAARDVRAQLKNSGLSQKQIEKYVEEEKKEAYRRAMAHDAFDDPNYLEHHGIKGQRWGVRRFQNIDGSLTEEGKMHRTKYISKETEKNNAYYAKYEAKYQKLADKAKTDEERAQYLAMKADATKSKNQVNEYLKNMSMDQILANEKEARDKAIKTTMTAAKVGLMGISMAGGVAGVAAGVRAGVAGATMAVSFLSNPDNQAMLANKAMKYAEMGIRTAVDVKQWATGVAIDEMASNIGKYTNPDDFRVVGEAAGRVVRSVSEGFSSTSGDAVSKATEKVTTAAVSGATKAVEQHGGDTGMAALKIAENLARETAKTSGEISGDAATTAENINDIVNLVAGSKNKIRHSAMEGTDNMDMSYEDFIEHHGIKGQKWGVRRFQDYNGQYTNAGLARYNYSRDAGKVLGQLDTERARAARKERKLEKKMVKANARFDKKLDKLDRAADRAGNNERKKAKIREQLSKEMAKNNKATDAYLKVSDERKSYEKQAENIKKQIKSEGFTIMEKPAARVTTTLKQAMIMQFCLGTIGTTALVYGTREQGTYYKVGNDIFWHSAE